MASFTITSANEHDLIAGAALLARTLAFDPADAIPAWLMHVSCGVGGVALAAHAGDELIGFSYATPGIEDAGPVLLSSGLAIAPPWQGRGVGLALKLAQGEFARANGIGRIRWHADAMAAAALRLYTSKLGASVTGYRIGEFDGLRAPGPVPQDDVDVEWDLAACRRSSGERRDVELPRDARALTIKEAQRWRLRVRESLVPLFDDGWIGIGVTPPSRATGPLLQLSRGRA